ncbi:MAG: type I glutamate--ammonia ligase [Thermoplasmatota archaeon]
MADSKSKVPTTPTEVVARLKSDGVKWIDLQFVDVIGGLQHITVPVGTMGEKEFKNGVGKLDGSSIKGFKDIHESDMNMLPDPTTYAVLPWYGADQKTARFYVDIYEGGTKTPQRFSRDVRGIAQRAAKVAKDAGYDTTYWGPELEFFVFDSVTITPNPTAAKDSWGGAGYQINSAEAPWGANSTGFPIRFKEGYYPAPPQDTLVDFRNEVCTILANDFGIEIDAHHHEVATAGQCEIDMHFDELVKMADMVTTYKNVVKMVAKKHGKIATFMPKPIFGDNASGMHVHQSLWNKGQSMMFDANDTYAELSQTARYYIGGLLEHARALCAITNPTTNSYRRLVPGYEAPVFIAWSKRNRSANVRIPMYETGNPKAKRVEYRTPDTAANIYLVQAALLAAGLDGIKNKIDPGNPVDEDLYHMPAAKRKSLGVRELPGSLKEALDELESDSRFLDGIIPKDLLEKYVDLKRDEHGQNAMRPTPYEFYRYLDL